jgi:hypothetical protein
MGVFGMKDRGAVGEVLGGARRDLVKELNFR